MSWSFLGRHIVAAACALVLFMSCSFILFAGTSLPALYKPIYLPSPATTAARSASSSASPSPSSLPLPEFRQVFNDSDFLPPSGVPAKPSFGQYYLPDELSHKDVNEDESVSRKLHFSSYLYRGYDDFVRTFGLELKAKLAPLAEKCKAFFDNLSATDPHWKIKEIKHFDRDIDDKEYVMERIKDDLKHDFERDYPGVSYKFTDMDKFYVQKKYETRIKESLEASQTISDDASIMRVFGKCFFNNDKDRDMDTYLKYSKKAYSFLGDVLPTFRHSASKHALEGVLPKFGPDNKYTGEGVAYNSMTDNFLEFMRSNLSGRGIVMSINSNYYRDVVGLVRVLRASNNDLPIQIVHRGDLDQRAQDAIHTAATEDIEAMFDREYNIEDSRVLPHIDFIRDAERVGAKFPEQQVWFVDASPCLHQDHRHKFGGFGNKMLAFFLNSFSEILFMDADAVPLVTTQELFASPEYQKHGSFLFRDRLLHDSVSYVQAVSALRLFPINDRSIDTLFDIPLVTNKTLGNSYLLGWFHCAESGLFLMDRKRHFLANIMLLQLTFWDDYTNMFLYGDKEWLWMAFAMAGGEDYAFNKYQAGAVGKSYTRAKVVFGKDTGSRTIVSSHPGHVNAKGTLLWINSGFKYCKKNGWEAHLDKEYYKEFAPLDLQSLFVDPVRLEAVIVPPETPPSFMPRAPWLNAANDRRERISHYYSHDRGKDRLLDGKPLKASQKSWRRIGGCMNYDHVAFEKIVSYDENKLYDYGEYFEFDTDTVYRHDYLGKVWLNLGKPKRVYAQKPRPKKTS